MELMTMATSKQNGAQAATQTASATTKAKTAKAAGKSAAYGEQARRLLEQAVASFGTLAKEQAKLSEDRKGVYLLTVEAAIAAGDVDTFSKVYGDLKTDINGNVGGIADRLECGMSKPDKDGKSYPVVPSGLRTAVSVVVAAMERKIPLSKGGKPRSFGEIRDDNAKALQAETVHKMTPEQKAREALRVMLAKVAESVSTMSPSDVADCTKIVRSLMTVADGSKDHDAKPASQPAKAQERVAA